MIELISPESGATVSLLTREQRAFVELFDCGEASYARRAEFGFTAENEPFDRLSFPAPVVFSFRADVPEADEHIYVILVCCHCLLCIQQGFPAP